MSSVVPEVDADTQVLVVLGATNPDPGHDGDGWFLADFCLLNQLLRNQGKKQVWLHSVDIDAALRRYGPIVHGSDRYPPRKVVFGATGQTLTDTRRVDAASLKAAFLHHLTAMVQSSRPADRLLIILLGHGQEPPYFGLVIGGQPNDDQDTPLNMLITNSDVDYITHRSGPPGLSLCIMCSSCFSANWICSSGSRSVLAATKVDSEAWSYDPSVSGAYGGSYFIGAIAEQLRRSSSTEGIYRQMCDGILENLETQFSLLVQQVPPQFAAQGDEWDVSVPQATEIAQQTYAQLYDSLPDYPTTRSPPGSPVHLAGGPRSRHLRLLVRHYTTICPGPENSSSNMKISGRIRRFLNVENPPLKPREIGWLAIALVHRIRLQCYAQEYVRLLGLSSFPTFDAWDFYEWRASHPSLETPYLASLEVLYAFHELFPRRPEVYIEEYQPWPKPRLYVAAAAATKGTDSMELYRRLATLYAFIFPGRPVPEERHR